jgi:hypothetical protein
MRYAYALARRGDTMKAAALIDETERILSSTTEIIKGSPNPKYISTSYVERQNLTRRMRIRRFTRLTNGFSKKLENHTAAVALHFVWYNFVRVHQTLRVTRRWKLAGRSREKSRLSNPAAWLRYNPAHEPPVLR